MIFGKRLRADSDCELLVALLDVDASLLRVFGRHQAASTCKQGSGTEVNSGPKGHDREFIGPTEGWSIENAGCFGSQFLGPHSFCLCSEALIAAPNAKSSCE